MHIDYSKYDSRGIGKRGNRNRTYNAFNSIKTESVTQRIKCEYEKLSRFVHRPVLHTTYRLSGNTFLPVNIKPAVWWVPIWIKLQLIFIT